MLIFVMLCKTDNVKYHSTRHTQDYVTTSYVTTQKCLQWFKTIECLVTWGCVFFDELNPPTENIHLVKFDRVFIEAMYRGIHFSEFLCNQEEFEYYLWNGCCHAIVNNGPQCSFEVYKRSCVLGFMSGNTTLLKVLLRFECVISFSNFNCNLF